MPRRRSDTMRAVDAVMPLVDEFNALDEGDKLTFLDLVDPLPEGHNHKPKKKASKKSSKSSSSKSPRASSLSSQLKSRTSEQREAATKDITGESNGGGIVLCGASLASSGANCNLPEGHALHADKGYVDYHPFRSGASTAPTAPTRSPANGGAGSGESETAMA